MDQVKKWQVVENVVRAFEALRHEGLSELQVTQKAKLPMRNDPTITREVDVLVRYKAGGRQIRIGIDVKDEARPLDITMLEQLYGKLHELQLDRRVVVSTSGFAKTAFDYYSRMGLELIPMDEADTLDWVAETAKMEVHRREFRVKVTSLEMAKEDEGRLPAPSSVRGRIEDLTIGGLNGGTTELPLLKYVGELLSKNKAESLWDQLGESSDITAAFTFTDDVRRVLWLTFRGTRIPCPMRIIVTFNIINWVEVPPLTKFKYPGAVEGVTAVLPLADALVQATLVMVPTEEGVSLQLMWGPALPGPTTVKDSE